MSLQPRNSLQQGSVRIRTPLSFDIIGLVACGCHIVDPAPQPSPVPGSGTKCAPLSAMCLTKGGGRTDKLMSVETVSTRTRTAHMAQCVHVDAMQLHGQRDARGFNTRSHTTLCTLPPPICAHLALPEFSCVNQRERGCRRHGVPDAQDT